MVIDRLDGADLGAEVIEDFADGIEWVRHGGTRKEGAANRPRTEGRG
jgi:hypothetical protein